MVTKNGDNSTALAPRDYHDIIAKVAAVKDVDVSKLERLMALQEEWEKRQAAAHYNNMMAKAQAEMEPVSKDSTNPMTRSRYASLPGLMEAIQPIYTKYGFSIEFDEDVDRRKDGGMLLVAYVSNGAETRVRKKWIPVTTLGIRGQPMMTPTHAELGGVTYGRRGLLKMIFNIAEVDDDGNMAGGRPYNPVAGMRGEPVQDYASSDKITSGSLGDEVPAQKNVDWQGHTEKDEDKVPDAPSDADSTRRRDLIIGAMERLKTAKALDTYGHTLNGTLDDMFPPDKQMIKDAFVRIRDEFRAGTRKPQL